MSTRGNVVVIDASLERLTDEAIGFCLLMADDDNAAEADDREPLIRLAETALREQGRGIRRSGEAGCDACSGAEEGSSIHGFGILSVDVVNRYYGGQK
ncbi:MAG: hypothetical protein GX446_05930 [Chthonomonadales bacterium]|nr:hypothetical protein [Chthonomonadales bacterium]